MSAIFISHSSKDAKAASLIKDWLEQQGHQSIFLDFDPQKGIPTGRNWEREIYRRLKTCRAVIALMSENSMDSKWCFAELAHARAMGKQIFPLKLDDSAVHGEMLDTQMLDITERREEAFVRLSVGLAAAGLDPGNLFDWDGRRPPYPGLLSFQREDAALYFGRGEEVRDTLDLLNRLRRFPGTRLTLVLGASGSGKSSLARAGVLPRLERDQQNWIALEPFRPLEDPYGELALALAAAFEKAGAPRDRAEMRAGLAAAAGGEYPNGAVLNELADELTIARKARQATVLLTIDQFEELLGYEAGDLAARFLALIASALGSERSSLIGLGTLRSDFLGVLQKHPAMADLRFESLSLGSMSKSAFARIIQGPAEVTGLELEEGLVEAMVEDTATEDALPLLAFTLRELFDRYGDDRKLEIGEYRDGLGGLTASVGRAAEAVLAAHPLSDEQTKDLRSALLNLVHINESGQYARRGARWVDLPESVHPVLERFVQARLLVSRGDGKTRRVEVAHEALFRAWHRMTTWLDEDQEFLLWRKRADAACAEWARTGGDSESLLRGPAMVEARDWLERRARLLPAEVAEFIQASVAADRRRKRTLLGVAAAVITVVTLLVSLVLSANLDTRRARAAWERAEQAAKQAELARMEAIALATKARRQMAENEERLRRLEESEEEEN